MRTTALGRIVAREAARIGLPLVSAALLGSASISAVTADTDKNSSKASSAAREAQRKFRLGNSAAWLPKFRYDALTAKGELPADVELIGQITKADIPVFKALLAPYLDSKYLQTHPRPRWFNTEPDDSVYTVTLDSPGGEVLAALELGRMFRKARVTVVVVAI